MSGHVVVPTDQLGTLLSEAGWLIGRLFGSVDQVMVDKANEWTDAAIALRDQAVAVVPGPEFARIPSWFELEPREVES